MEKIMLQDKAGELVIKPPYSIGQICHLRAFCCFNGGKYKNHIETP